MRVGFVRNVGLAALGLAVVALAACNDDPLGFDKDRTTDMFVNPSVMVVPAGRVSKLESRALNEGGEPTFAAVEATVSPACVTVAPDPDATNLNPPGLFVVTGLNGLGVCTITLTSGGVSKEVEVSVVTEAVELTCPSTVRGGDTGSLTARLVSFDGETVTPFDQTTDVVWASDDAAVVSVDSNGDYVATDAGSATITATWSGTDATGTTGLVTRVGSCTILVAGGPPASAEFADVDAGGSIGTYEPAETLAFEVLVLDALGNVTFDPTEITGITVASSDPTVATATATREELTADEVVLTVTVETVGPGITTLSGVVQTTEGDLPYQATLSVVAPNVTAVAPDPAGAEDALTITGTGLSLAGLTTTVSLNGFPAASVTVVSAAELTVVPPLFGDAGAVEVVVTVGGVASTPVSYTQTGQWDAEAYEPGNDDLPDAPIIGSPVNFTGSVDGTDVDDLFRIVVTEETTFDLTMDWTDAAADLDIAVVNEGFTAYVCADGATGAKPENTVCTLSPGTYFLWVNFYDGPAATDYTVTSN
jgi:hypothetical protein